MIANPAQQEFVESIVSGIGKRVTDESAKAEKEHIHPKSSIPKSTEKVVSDSENLSDTLLAHLDSWFEEEAKSMSARMEKSSGTQNKIGSIKEYELRRNAGVDKFILWLEDLQIEQAIKEEIKHETYLRVGVMWMIDRISDKNLKNGESGYNPYLSGEGGAKIMSLLTQEMLFETNETGNSGYVRDPLEFWTKMEKMVPKNQLFQKAFETLKHGSLAEVMAGRAIDKALAQEENMRLEVSTPKSDANNGYDLIIMKSDKPLFLVDVKSWSGGTRIISHGKGEATKYDVDGFPQDVVDAMIWQIPESLVESSRRKNIAFMCIRLDLAQIDRENELTGRLRNIIGRENQDEGN
jgi:hypothetical protein